MSTDQLLADVRAVVLHELEDLAPSSVVLRLDDFGERSVLVIAHLDDGAGSVMIGRVHESDLRARRQALHPVFLSGEEAAVLVEVLAQPAGVRPKA